MHNAPHLITRFRHTGAETELLRLLEERLAGMSRSRLKRLLGSGAVLLDRRCETQFDAIVKDGVEVEVLSQPPRGATRNKYFSIVYEDRYLIVVDKAEGVLSMQTGQRGECLKTLLDQYLVSQNKRERVHIVHRLDRETSGLMVLAKSVEVQQQFVNNWKGLVNDRLYVAVLEGLLEKKAGVLTSWLWEDSRFVMHSSPNPTPDGRSKQAVTHFRVLRVADGRSLTEFKLETGRKNQIRVHAAQLLRSPIVGDRKYGSSTGSDGRLFLHAQTLAFRHPVTGKSLSFQTPLPAAFLRLMQP